jgi:hypothetical protein
MKRLLTKIKKKLKAFDQRKMKNGIMHLKYVKMQK